MNTNTRTLLVGLAGSALLSAACDRQPAAQPAKAPVQSSAPAPDTKTPSSDASDTGTTPSTPPANPAPTEPTSGWGMNPPPQPPVEAPKPPPVPDLPAPYTGPDKPIASDAKPLSRTTLPLGGVELEEFRVGTGSIALPKSTIWIKCIGRLKGADKPFENNYETGMVYGNLEQMLPGLRNGIIGMRVGGQRRIHIPSSVGYGDFGRKDFNGVMVVPPNTDLVFDVELLGVSSVIVDAPPPTPFTPTPISGQEPPKAQ